MVEMGRFEVPEEEKSKRYYVEASVSGFLDGMSEEAVREEMKKILDIPQIAIANQLKYSISVHVISKSLG